MDFVVNEVMKFKHINTANGNAVKERLTGAAVEKKRFAIDRERGKRDGVEEIKFFSAVENRRSEEGRRIRGIRIKM